MDQQQSNHELRMFMVIAFVLALVSGVAICSYWWGIKSVSVPEKNQTAMPKSPVVSTELKAAPGNKSLSVTTPKINQAISTPVRVAGNSNFFEAHTSIRVKDANGKVLTQSFATADGWMDKLYPFATYVSYGQPATATGTVEVYEASAQDGSDQNLISIPVKFADASDKDWTKVSAKFENAMVSGLQQEVGAELSPQVNFIIDATECCGPLSKSKALPQIIQQLGYAGLIDFSQDNAQVKKIRAGKDSQYFSQYDVIGVSDKKFVVAYHVGAGGKVDNVFFSGGMLDE